MQICIDCGRELFDSDKMCDKCNSSNIISEKEYQQIVSEIKNVNFYNKNKLLQNEKYRKVYNITQRQKEEYPASSILLNNVKQHTETTEEYWDRINKHTINKVESSKPVVICPHCHSTNTKKISGISKAGSVAMWGIFSQKVKKQWHCNHCGSDF